MKNSRRSIVALAVTCGLVLTACSAGETDSANNKDPIGRITVALASDLNSIDPAVANTNATTIVMRHVCDSLFDTDADGNSVPRLATEMPTVAEDGLTFTIPLRDDVAFHDGAPVDSQAVKASLERAIGLKGHSANQMASIDTIEATDPYTLTVKTAYPDPALVRNLSGTPSMIQQVSAMADPSAEVTQGSYCSGPYVLTDRVVGNSVMLERAENADASVGPESIEFRIISDPDVRVTNLISGEIDFAERVQLTDVDTIAQSGNADVLVVPGAGFTMLMVNTAGDTPLAGSLELRQAFNLSIDREAINQAVAGGKHRLSCGPVEVADDMKCAGFDLAKAKKLVDASGQTKPVKVTFAVQNAPLEQTIGQMVQDMASKAGFEVELVTTDFATLIGDWGAGNFDISMLPWAGLPDISANVGLFARTDGGYNFTGAGNEQIDALLDSAKVELDEQKRHDFYLEAMQQFQDEYAAYMFLYNQAQALGYSKKWAGFEFNPFGLLDLRGLTRAA